MANAHVEDGRQVGGPVGASLENLRASSIIVYLLYLAAICNGLTAVIGVVLAYVKRNEARGTIHEGHIANAIELFWVGLVVGIAAAPLVLLFGLGVLIYLALGVWLIYRIIKGLVCAIENKPCHR